MATTGLVSYKQKYENALGSLRRFRDASKAPLQTVMCTASGVAGGVAAGALEAKLPKVGPIPTGPVIGAMAVVGAIMNAEESWSQNLNCFGTTMLGCAAYKETYKLLSDAPLAV